MYSKKQFTALEAMCREQAALARREMEYALMQYWLAEAEEWKQFRQPAPFRQELRAVPRALSEQHKAADARGEITA